MKCTVCPTPRDVSISCATDKELITKIGAENYTSYYRHMAACELAERLLLKSVTEDKFFAAKHPKQLQKIRASLQSTHPHLV